MVVIVIGKKMASTSTVSYQFRNQLELLIQTLTLTAPHYIKCIKPNRFKQAMNFDKCAQILNSNFYYS